jgi:hypothetical protein
MIRFPRFVLFRPSPFRVSVALSMARVARLTSFCRQDVTVLTHD